MKAIISLGLALSLLGCSGIGDMSVQRMSNAELKTRFADLEREQATYQAGESDPARLKHFEQLTREAHAVERELYDRCMAGDQDACLPRFHPLRR